MKKYPALLFVLLLSACPSDTPDPDPTDASLDLSTKDDVGETPDQSTDAGEDADPTEDTGGLEDMQIMELENEELLQALRDAAIETQISLGYNLARDYMYTFGGIEDQNGRVECIYTGRTTDVDNTRTPSANCTLADGTPTTCTFNTEHTFARIHLRNALTDGSPEYNTAEGDLHHLFPSDEDANNARANFDFGETDCDQMGNCRYNEESFLGIRTGAQGSTTCPQDAPCVMEVRASRRGDVARALFYMAMRYELNIPPTSEATIKMWHSEDPPDDYERTRDDNVEQIQGNRNPFILQPELVDRVADF